MIITHSISRLTSLLVAIVLLSCSGSISDLKIRKNIDKNEALKLISTIENSTGQHQHAIKTCKSYALNGKGNFEIIAKSAKNLAEFGYNAITFLTIAKNASATTANGEDYLILLEKAEYLDADNQKIIALAEKLATTSDKEKLTEVREKIKSLN